MFIVQSSAQSTEDTPAPGRAGGQEHRGEEQAPGAPGEPSGSSWCFSFSCSPPQLGPGFVHGGSPRLWGQRIPSGFGPCPPISHPTQGFPCLGLHLGQGSRNLSPHSGEGIEEFYQVKYQKDALFNIQGKRNILQQGDLEEK